MNEATHNIRENAEGGLDSAFAHTFDPADVVRMACMFVKRKADLSRDLVEYTRLLSDDDLVEFREAERLAMALFGNKRKLDPTMALWEDGR